MKVVLAGGTGQLGRILDRALRAQDHQVTILGRLPVASRAGVVPWDARTLGDWTRVVDGCDVVVNLAGRSVSCRYTNANMQAMLRSRVDSARVLGLAIERAAAPPRLWLQMSTATIYAHRFDAPNDELTGRIGGDEPDAPVSWRSSIEIARAWEAAQHEASTPRTRKVALRAAMVMSPDPGGAFDLLLRLARLGAGGAVAGGAQYMSWIHDRDFARAVDFLVARDDIEGPVNLAAPAPLPQREFMAALRAACDRRIGLSATRWMAEAAAWLLRTETELILKSRRVIPGRLHLAGFQFAFPDWPAAASDLVQRWRAHQGLGGLSPK